MRLALLLLLPTYAAASVANNAIAGYSTYATQLHDDLLNGYNKAVPPPSVRLVNYSDAGTDVKLKVRFFKVEAVQPAVGLMAVKVWWKMWWSDLRLSWDPAAYGGITEIKFHASTFSDPETSDIWLPDVTVYNAVNGLMHSLDPAMASVYSDGTVFWSRPGMLSLMCRFSGLVMFP